MKKGKSDFDGKNVVVLGAWAPCNVEAFAIEVLMLGRAFLMIFTFQLKKKEKQTLEDIIRLYK